MRRYIDADKIEYEDMLRPCGDGNYEECQIAYRDQIDDIPTAGVVEVVRCKDCRWKQGSECVRFADVRPFPDDFCSRAEMRGKQDERINQRHGYSRNL